MPKIYKLLLSPLVHKCSHYKIVIVHGSIATDTKTEVPDNTLLLDSQTQTSYYVAAAFSVEEFQCTFLIGDEQTHNETFVNVPLSSDQEYTVFIRLYSGLNVLCMHDVMWEGTTRVRITTLMWSLYICRLLFLRTAYLGHSVSKYYSISSIKTWL